MVVFDWTRRLAMVARMLERATVRAVRTAPAGGIAVPGTGAAVRFESLEVSAGRGWRAGACGR